jgi:hypothetical protein
VVALLVQHDELIGVPDRELPQQHLVDQRENGRVGANAQGQRQDRDEREEWAAAQSADGELEVGQNGGHRGVRRDSRAERLVRQRMGRT